ncbi:pyridoxal phosphate-dependent transferase [Suillus subalutaceus]|uniref:pyridoxal phosphate-dependent transferase n=1 Tax=Suillus subalutaceus TaxID=48586 RepID=UPI001B86D9C8|nr:pyridoxal phosphate-dependent transferase [Suillus subalutaceus]KAG1874474.1 pyridoxal phosphate-dependent transferase [Suillus subalutaceus]
MSIEKHGTKSIDLSHHLSELSKARTISPLKGVMKYFAQPGILSLAGGLPSPAYFPVSDISANVLVPESFALSPTEPSTSLSWLWKLFGSHDATKEKTQAVTIPKYPVVTGEINLATSLQYGQAIGMAQLQDFLKQFISEVYRPAFEDWAVLIDTGNTDGGYDTVQPWRGCVLCEEWTYPSAVASMVPFNIKPVPVAMDGLGMKSDDLENLLSQWDPVSRQMPRPHVMYIVPVGQNPSGSTMSVARKKQIYDICVKYDVIIVEDDPYYFLQLGTYTSKDDRFPGATPSGKPMSPSFFTLFHLTIRFSFDYQGRVIRLDTFSKTIAPGSRLGWFTCNPAFAERLERQGETSTQAPCGFGQAVVTKILMHWTYDGYIRWLRGLRTEYQQRRDFFIDCLAEEFHLHAVPAVAGVWEGCTVYQASSKVKKSTSMTEKYSARDRTMFSFVPPVAGMFVWMKLHLDQHPSFAPGDEDTLETKLWTKLAENGVLFGPGWIFAANAIAEDSHNNDSGHFRVSFSNAEFADLKKAVTIFGQIIREFFQEEDL